MVHRHLSRKDPEAESAVAPAYSHRLDLEPIPQYRLPEQGARPEAAYRRRRARRAAAGQSTNRPNLILGSNVQVVWEKFCRYWDVEPRYIPVQHGRYVITPDEVVARIDEKTIGVLQEIHAAVVAHNEATGQDVPVHVDAASGGVVAPFLHPDLAWDFRLPMVESINVSGHKYRLVYRGVGFVVWRDRRDLPEDLVHVDYLGGDMPTSTLNFSRPGNQIIGQYYDFLRRFSHT